MGRQGTGNCFREGMETAEAAIPGKRRPSQMSVPDALIARFFDSCRTVRPKAGEPHASPIAEATLTRGICAQEPKFTLILPCVRGPLPSGFPNGIPSTIVIHKGRTSVAFLRNFLNFPRTLFEDGGMFSMPVL